MTFHVFSKVPNFTDFSQSRFCSFDLYKKKLKNALKILKIAFFRIFLIITHYFAEDTKLSDISFSRDRF